MEYIDLHVHSYASDGSFAPREVISLAKAAHLSAIALTDHDTINGIYEASIAAKEYDIRLVPGIEMSCAYEGNEIHILGYFIKYNDPDTLDGLSFFQKQRDDRNKIMLDNFHKDNIDITYDDLIAGNPHTLITRVHFANALIDKGYAKDKSDAFTRFLQYGGRYLPIKRTTPKEVMDMFDRCHIWSSLAHPMQYKLSDDRLDKLVHMLSSAGLCGIEVYHSNCKEKDYPRLLSLCDRYNLLPTGGSDFHGINKPDISIGIGRGNLHIPISLLEAIDKNYQNMI